MKPTRDYDTDPLTDSEAALLDENDELREEVERMRVRAAVAVGVLFGVLITASCLI